MIYIDQDWPSSHYTGQAVAILQLTLGCERRKRYSHFIYFRPRQIKLTINSSSL